MDLSSNNRFTSCFLPVALFVALWAAGCAPTLVTPEISADEARVEAARQREMALSIAVSRHAHLLDIAMPLLRSAVDLCPDHSGRLYGFLLHDQELYGPEWEDVAARYFKMGRGVYLRYVHPALGAAGAGLARGDRVIAVQGTNVETLGAKDAMRLVQRAAALGEPLKLTVERVERGRGTVDIVIEGDEACLYRIVMVSDDSVNAYADGSVVAVTTGMLRFVESDAELSLVTAHEISHNALGHVTKQTGNILLGTLLDILIAGTTGVDTGGTFGKVGGAVYSRGFEAEADYAGLYIAARAGYDVAGAANFWRRMAVEHPGAIKETFMASHPSSPRRFLAIEKTVEEIEAKRLKGEPLLPDKKGR